MECHLIELGAQEFFGEELGPPVCGDDDVVGGKGEAVVVVADGDGLARHPHVLDRGGLVHCIKGASREHSGSIQPMCWIGNMKGT